MRSEHTKDPGKDQTGEAAGGIEGTLSVKKHTYVKQYREMGVAQ